MESVPLYLVVFCWKIRKGSLKEGYLRERFEKLEKLRVIDEADMLKKLVEYDLVALSEVEDVIVFKPERTAPNGLKLAAMDEKAVVVRFPIGFATTSRWRYLWTEYVTRGVAWLAVAVLGGLIASSFK